MHILPAAVIGFLATFVAAGLVMMMLLVPVIVVDALNSMTAKTVTIIVFCAIFVMFLPSLTKANIKETVVAGTT